MNMKHFGQWRERITIEGKTYRGDKLGEPYTSRLGFSAVYAVDGLPPSFERALLTAAQVCDVPHTWRVQEVASETEVTESLLEKARAALRRDQDTLNAHIISYCGQDTEGKYTFLAAGALRDKLTRTFHHPQFPVVSRAVVAPRWRGFGLGTLIVAHRITCAMSYFSSEPKAIHFGTECGKILASVKKAEAAHQISFVHIGDEEYTTNDGTHSVRDYLCYLPHYQKQLNEAIETLALSASSPAIWSDLRDALRTFIQFGVVRVKVSHLIAVITQALSSLPQSATEKREYTLLNEVKEIIEVIGAKDPVA